MTSVYDNLDSPENETEISDLQDDNEDPNREVGRKNKKWESTKERDRHYKKLNNGPTISTRKKIGEEKEYPPIPEEGLILPGYEISQFGRVKLQNGSITTGSSADRSKMEFPHYKTFTLSRLVASSFGILDDNDHDIDHIDPSKPLNNSLSNLQSLSRSDHAKKTHQDNPHIGKDVQKSLSKRILGRKLGSSDNFVEYISSREASKATGVNHSNIRSICAKRQTNDDFIYHCGGYEWKYGDRSLGVAAPTDAIWKRIYRQDGRSTDHYVCQYGLIRRDDGFITPGSLNAGRYIFVAFQVSILVALAFLPPPSDSTQTTVNHRDLNPLNNHRDNLEWANDKEQVNHSLITNPHRKNRAITKRCSYCHKENSEWIICDSLKEASENTGVSVRAIRKNFLRDTFTEKGFRFKEIPVELLPEETFVPLRLYYKKERNPRRVTNMLQIVQSDDRAHTSLT